MSTKERLLSLLQARNEEFLSGEEIASLLSVSRTAVWKAANALRRDGVALDAVQNRGYRLQGKADMLSADGIVGLLDCPDAVSLHVLPSVPSTNAFLRERASLGAAEGEVIVAGEQVAGRGRLGREFFSPRDSGLYLSVLLRPVGFTAEQAVKITTMAAVAACQAIEDLAPVCTRIKWVNDLFINDRKVGGILTEGSFSLETGELDCVILGVGINLYPPRSGFPPELIPIAGTVFDRCQSQGRNRLAAHFLNHFFAIYRGTAAQDYASIYRQKSFIIGKRVIIAGATEKAAIALDVDRDCRLLVRYEDGSLAALSSAEVRILPCSES